MHQPESVAASIQFALRPAASHHPVRCSLHSDDLESGWLMPGLWPKCQYSSWKGCSRLPRKDTKPVASADLQERVQGQLHRGGVAPRVGHQSGLFNLVPVDLSQPIYCLLLQLLGLVLPTVPASTGSNRPEMTTVADTMRSATAAAGIGRQHSATFTCCLSASATPCWMSRHGVRNLRGDYGCPSVRAVACWAGSCLSRSPQHCLSALASGAFGMMTQ